MKSIRFCCVSWRLEWWYLRGLAPTTQPHRLTVAAIVTWWPTTICNKLNHLAIFPHLASRRCIRIVIYGRMPQTIPLWECKRLQVVATPVSYPLTGVKLHPSVGDKFRLGTLGIKLNCVSIRSFRIVYPISIVELWIRLQLTRTSWGIMDNMLVLIVEINWS